MGGPEIHTIQAELLGEAQVSLVLRLQTVSLWCLKILYFSFAACFIKIIEALLVLLPCH